MALQALIWRNVRNAAELFSPRRKGAPDAYLRSPVPARSTDQTKTVFEREEIEVLGMAAHTCFPANRRWDGAGDDQAAAVFENSFASVLGGTRRGQGE